MKRILSLLALCIVPGLQAEESERLPDDFVSARPSVQLFQAYAEFKMAHYETARRMWQQIGGSGRAEAQFNLAILYDDGLGVTPDLARALQYYQEAAEGGSRAAAYRLGLLHLRDPRLPEDPQQARYWLSRAAQDGDTEAAVLLDSLKRGDNMSDALVEIDGLLLNGNSVAALARLEQLVADGDTRAMNRLAWLYESGVHVERDLSRAAQLFRQAAALGDAPSQYALGVMLTTGAGQSLDTEAGKQWLQRAAEQGHLAAKRSLREMR